MVEAGREAAQTRKNATYDLLEGHLSRRSTLVPNLIELIREHVLGLTRPAKKRQKVLCRVQDLTRRCN